MRSTIRMKRNFKLQILIVKDLNEAENSKGSSEKWNNYQNNWKILHMNRAQHLTYSDSCNLQSQMKVTNHALECGI